LRQRETAIEVHRESYVQTHLEKLESLDFDQLELEGIHNEPNRHYKCTKPRTWQPTGQEYGTETSYNTYNDVTEFNLYMESTSVDLGVDPSQGYAINKRSRIKVVYIEIF
jgi:hypothetical protein